MEKKRKSGKDGDRRKKREADRGRGRERDRQREIERESELVTARERRSIGRGGMSGRALVEDYRYISSFTKY